jgi:hypothetical protein
MQAATATVARRPKAAPLGKIGMVVLQLLNACGKTAKKKEPQLTGCSVMIADLVTKRLNSASPANKSIGVTV